MNVAASMTGKNAAIVEVKQNPSGRYEVSVTKHKALSSFVFISKLLLL
jgi:hypothetical protein